MKKIFLVLSVLLSFQLSLSASESKRCLESIKSVSTASGKATVFHFNDGMSCVLNGKKIEKPLLNHWKKGDPIEVSTSKQDFILMNTNSDICYFPKVTFTKKIVGQFPKLKEVISKQDSEYNYRKNNSIVLTDGTVFVDDGWNEDELKKWKKGDSIFVSRNQEDVELINLSILYTSDWENAKISIDNDD